MSTVVRAVRMSDLAHRTIIGLKKLASDYTLF